MKQDFSSKLQSLYPSLFHKDSDGNTMEPSCGAWVPPGWEHLVTQLCHSIDSHVQNDEKLTQKYKTWFSIKNYLYLKLIVPVHNVVHNIIDPYRQYRSDADKNRKYYYIRPEISKLVKEKHPYRLTLLNWEALLFSKFRPRYKWHREKIAEVKIAQVKEKFGELRFYYDGGDDKISGMVRFAEALSAKTCEESGEVGSLCKKGKGMNWYRTLSPKMAKKFGYIAASENYK